MTFLCLLSEADRLTGVEISVLSWILLSTSRSSKLLCDGLCKHPVSPDWDLDLVLLHDLSGVGPPASIWALVVLCSESFLPGDGLSTSPVSPDCDLDRVCLHDLSGVGLFVWGSSSTSFSLSWDEGGNSAMFICKELGSFLSAWLNLPFTVDSYETHKKKTKKQMFILIGFNSTVIMMKGNWLS